MGGLERRPEGILIPAGLRVGGTVQPPPSKSLTHRAFVLALLAGEPLVVERPLAAEDTALFRQALERLGWRVEPNGEADAVPPPPAVGGAVGLAAAARGGPGAPHRLAFAPGRRPSRAEVFCGNAGTMCRFLVAALAAIPGEWRLDGVPRLRERTVGPLVEALRGLGAEIVCEEREGFAPLAIRGRRLRGGRVALDAGVSSQFLSALLMAALVAEGEVEIAVPALTSRPYVDLTLDAIARFGGRVEATADGYRVRPGLASPGTVRVEGDFSAAAYPAAAAALTGGRVLLTGLPAASRQGDRGFLDLLAAMGARVEWRPEEDAVEVAGTGRLEAVDRDLSAMPDQVPTLAALAPFARGTTVIRGVPHLRIKESDRLAAMVAGLRAIGAEADETPDGLVVPGVWAERRPEPPPAPLAVDPHGDHRIAMSLAVAGLARPGVLITHPEVVEKSYPRFWQDLAGLLGG
jgi:3-phosphoshikimate 1-carboxyvinyltransferase